MTTLSTLTASLELLCDQLDTDDEIPQDLLDRFVDAKLEHSKKVGAYISVIETLKHTEEFYKKKAEYFQKRAKSYERLEKGIKERLLYAVKTHPSLPWNSDDGRRLSLRDNPESLKLNFALDKRSLSNILTTIDDIPFEFVDVSSFHQLNVERVKAYLKAGNTLSWATLDRGKHLRIT